MEISLGEDYCEGRLVVPNLRLQSDAADEMGLSHSEVSENQQFDQPWDCVHCRNNTLLQVK